MRRSQFTGCIVGLAVGDALGYPHEFRTVKQVRKEIGPQGISDFLALKDPRFTRPMIAGPDHPPGTFTDDTQMSIAVAEALLTAGRRSRDALMTEMGRLFVEWYESDDNNRSPGATCGTACERLRDGAGWREAGVAQSKGCGSVMRVAPIGLYYDDLDEVCEVARDSSILTHGHPTALEACAGGALAVALAARGLGPRAIYEEIMERCGGKTEDFDACLQKVPTLLDREPGDVLVEGALGESWIAEEALASALWCFWRHPDDYRACVLEAVNTDGDSDSIACIAGAIVGARVGLENIPKAWVENVEASARLLELGERLADARFLAVARGLAS